MRSKKKSWWTRLGWGAFGLAVVALLVRAFQPAPILVDVATITRTTLRVTVDDDGRTRVRERYTITAPIEGRLLRTALDPGDPIRAHDTVIAEFAPVSPTFQDTRSRAEATARLARAEAATKELTARCDQAVADLDLASAELHRVRELLRSNASAVADLDVAQRNERSAREGLRAAQFAVEVARFEEELARASLDEPTVDEIEEHGDGRSEEECSRTEAGRRLQLRSPIHGRVLRVYEESARSLSAGSPLIEVGNTDSLEVVVDYLTQDAVKVRPGMAAFIEGWGGESSFGEERVLRGRVRTVEPGGFTKISALGVEEQRVNVIVDPIGEPEEWAALGDGYHIEVRILLWEEGDVLIVPTGALFREDDNWAVFVFDDGVVRQRLVRLGRRSGLEAEVLEGLEEGVRVVLYPSELLRDGAPVKTQL